MLRLWGWTVHTNNFYFFLLVISSFLRIERRLRILVIHYIQQWTFCGWVPMWLWAHVIAQRPRTEHRFWSLLSLFVLGSFALLFVLTSIWNTEDSNTYSPCRCRSASQSCPTLRPDGLLHARLPCPSPFPGACSNPCPLSRQCHPSILSSVVPSSSCLLSFPAAGPFPMNLIIDY